jgi:acyl-CoA-dependent ceramide synthase
VLCDAATAIFFASWILTRHVFFGLVIWSAYNAPALIPYGWIPEDKYWFTKQVYVVFVSLLVALQVRVPSAFCGRAC